MEWHGDHVSALVMMQGWTDQLSGTHKYNSYHGEPYIPADVFNVSIRQYLLESRWMTMTVINVHREGGHMSTVYGAPLMTV